jgi:hypothetical protein
MGSAARMQAFRSRQKAGTCVLAIEADEIGLTEALTRSGFIQSSEPTREEIRAALERVVALWIEEEIGNEDFT